MSETFNKEYSEKCRSLILEYAVYHPEFRKKLHQLSQTQEQLRYPDIRTYTHLMGQAMQLINEIASDCGLFEAVNWSHLSNEQVQQFLSWMLEKSPELSYYVEERAKKQQPKSTSRPFQEKVDVFLSWSISSPRERTAMLGVKDSLDDFGIKYYDFTEHRVDSSRDESDKIEAKICEAINQSVCSIELTSSEFQGPWIEFERRQLRKKENIVRIILHLDQEFGVYANDEFRILRLQFSDGRYRAHRTDDQSWQDQAFDASHYQSQDYLSKCYALAHLVRNICNEKEPIKIITSLKPSQFASPEKLSFPTKPVGFEETRRLLGQYGLAKQSQRHTANQKVEYSLWFHWVIACTIGLSIGTSSFEMVGFWGVAIFGVSVGIFQWLVLRRYALKVNSWIWWSTFGSVLGFAVVPGHIGTLGVGAIIGTIIGVAQGNVIKWGVIAALMWILANIFGFALGFAIANSLGLYVSNYIGNIWSGTIGGAAGGMVLGIITGTALIGLLRRFSSER